MKMLTRSKNAWTSSHFQTHPSIRPGAFVVDNFCDCTKSKRGRTFFFMVTSRPWNANMGRD